MLLFPAANISCCDFCVKEMRSKGAELHHVEVSGGAGLGAGMGWYLLTLIRWQEEEWTVNELLGKVPEVASINEFERLEKTKNREEKMHGNGIQLNQIWLVCTGLGLLIPVPEASTAKLGFACVSFRHCNSGNVIECWAEGEVSGCWVGSLQLGELSGHCWLKVSARWIGPDLSYNCRHSMVWCTALMYCESILYPAAWWLAPSWSLNSES